jgi:hypothetical protein
VEVGAVTLPFAGAAGTVAHEVDTQVGAAVHDPLVWHVAVVEPVSVYPALQL